MDTSQNTQKEWGTSEVDMVEKVGGAKFRKIFSAARSARRKCPYRRFAPKLLGGETHSPQSDVWGAIPSPLMSAPGGHQYLSQGDLGG